MKELSVSLVELHPDARSQESTLTLSIENSGDKPIKITAINPSIPDGIEVIERFNVKMVLLKQEQKRLCGVIQTSLAAAAAIYDQDFRHSLVQANAGILRELDDRFRHNCIGFATSFLTKRILVELDSELKVLDTTIKSSSDANAWLTRLRSEAAKNFSENGASHDDFCFFRIEKLIENLKSVENEISLIRPELDGILVVEAKSSFHSNLFVKCDRGISTFRKFIISVAVTPASYETNDSNPKIAACEIGVTPSPLIIFLMSVVGGMIGFLIYTTHAQKSWNSLQFLGAIFLAVIVVHCCEFIDAFKKVREKLDWRIAMVLGALTGIFQDRILTAVQALLGAK